LANDITGPKDDPVMTLLTTATQRYFAGDLKGAISDVAAAAETARAAGNGLGLFSALVQEAGWLREIGDLPRYRNVLSEAEASYEVVGVSSSTTLASLRLEQAHAAQTEGDLPRAETLLIQAAEAASASVARDVLLNDILANLASVYLSQGKLKEALVAGMKAVEIDRSTGNQPALSNDLNVVGLIYQEQGDQATARLYLEEALKVAVEGGYVKQAADAASNLAAIDDETGRYADAQAAFEQALKVYEETGNKAELGSTLNSLAISAVRSGDNKSARDLLQRAQAAHSEAGDQTHLAYDLLMLSNVEGKLGEYEAAYQHAVDASELAGKLGLRGIRWVTEMAIAHSRAATLKGLGDPKQVLDALVNEVLPAYVRAVEWIDLLRSGIGRPEERQYILWNKEDIYEEAILLCGVLRKMSVAFSFSEGARARSFLEAVGESRLSRQDATNPLTAQRTKLEQALTDQPDRPDAAALLDELRTLRARILAEAPALAAVTEAKLPTLADISSKLPANTAIVTFFLGQRQQLAIFVVSSKGVAAFSILELGSLDLKQLINQFRAEIEYQVDGLPTGEKLFLILFSQVFDALEPFDHLLIVPHRDLNYLPFSSLWFSNTGEGPKRLYLCQRFITSVLPSASFLPICEAMSPPAIRDGGALVLGNPVGDLMGAEREAKDVAALFGVQPLLRGQATRQAVLEGAAGLGVVHIAAHGGYNKADPLLSSMQLADGFLSVEDLMEHRIDASLMVLSGCVTGQAERLPGDELIGLARSAVSAGIPTVVTALWPTYDQSSAEFFGTFYRSLRDGNSKADALWHAQQYLLASKDYSLPVHWAPYVLLGDPR
jgi:CHAT domain-containing protein/Tfp pilus assembly protein PilF